MKYSIETIADWIDGESSIAWPGCEISNVQIDHRNVKGNSTLFVAIMGQKFDGHLFISELLSSGTHSFIVSDPDVYARFQNDANVILVSDVIVALQMLAHKHRSQYVVPCIAITGSNGKTIVKEWLNTLLESSESVCRSPKSFNSQIGVPISVLQLEPKHTLAIFEAGISMAGEMGNLKNMIEPTVGVFTNLGDAHDAGFATREQKLNEKMALFHSSEKLVCCKDQLWFISHAKGLNLPFFTWSQSDKLADVYVNDISIHNGSSHIELVFREVDYFIEVPFDDRASIENSIHCFATLAATNRIKPEVLRRFKQLAPVAMRMEIKKGVENSTIIDDSYNADLGSMTAALEQLKSLDAVSRMAILSDFDNKSSANGVYDELVDTVNGAQLDEVVLIGDQIRKYAGRFSAKTVVDFNSADAWLDQLSLKYLRDKAILIKGARVFKFERLVKRLQAQQHQTRLEIDLQKLSGNLRYYRSLLSPETKIMVMVKAFAYGSGSLEIAQLLQQEKVDYLAVAYTDEGISLRKKGIRIPIMVMSPNKSEFEQIIRNNLEPEIYSTKALMEFVETAKANRHLFNKLRIHVKVDSGMHRLGIDAADVDTLVNTIKSAEFISLASVFTHLAASDDLEHDDFTHKQVATYQGIADRISDKLEKGFDRHVLNSSGALRFNQYRFDMVRLGIGLYGFASTDHDKHLLALGTLKSYILQTRKIPAGESIGYSRLGVFESERTIATVAVGYADGLDRKLGNGKWALYWNGKPCTIVGNICMDMCMIDITGLDAREGDEVVVFSGAKDIRKMASIVGTIPYEILTNISDRVSRVYLKE